MDPRGIQTLKMVSFFHPDYHRRHWNHTSSVRRLAGFTAGIGIPPFPEGLIKYNRIEAECQGLKPNEPGDLHRNGLGTKGLADKMLDNQGQSPT